MFRDTDSRETAQKLKEHNMMKTRKIDTYHKEPIYTGRARSRNLGSKCCQYAQPAL